MKSGKSKKTDSVIAREGEKEGSKDLDRSMIVLKYEVFIHVA